MYSTSGEGMGLSAHGTDVGGLHALSPHALLHHLEHDFLHLLVRGLELADEDDHHLTSVVVGVHTVHQGDDEADALHVDMHES